MWAPNGAGDDLEVGELFRDALGHGGEAPERVPDGAVGGGAERGGDVAFVAEEDIDEGHQAAVDVDAALAAAAALPERGAVVAVEADDGAVALGGFHGLADDGGGGFAERGHDAAGVEPAGTFAAEK